MQMLSPTVDYSVQLPMLQIISACTWFLASQVVQAFQWNSTVAQWNSCSDIQTAIIRVSIQYYHHKLKHNNNSKQNFTIWMVVSSLLKDPPTLKCCCYCLHQTKNNTDPRRTQQTQIDNCYLKHNSSVNFKILHIKPNNNLIYINWCRW